MCNGCFSSVVSKILGLYLKSLARYPKSSALYPKCLSCYPKSLCWYPKFPFWYPKFLRFPLLVSKIPRLHLLVSKISALIPELITGVCPEARGVAEGMCENPSWWGAVSYGCSQNEIYDIGTEIPLLTKNDHNSTQKAPKSIILERIKKSRTFPIIWQCQIKI